MFEVRYVPGPMGGTYALTDPEGNVIPCQRAVTIEQRVNDAATVTVEFIVDDRKLKLTDKRAVTLNDD